ncbi:SH2 domain-containing adapter protein E [Salmo trutta]|uniref:SH2 domain-containing adapter protein E n=1 Tax=Salmo trutta TaxID=8032 RepID=A0A674EHZ4_SALTR|nr:SH2 domain-containing adapter protein E-like [Salmo trutta]
MAKWFSSAINLKNGTERVRSASESGPQPRTRHGLTPGTSLKGNRVKESAGGMGSILTGRNRKNSAIELGRNGSGTGGNSFKDGKIWESLIPGKSRKNSKLEVGASEEHRPTRTSSLAHACISRMIKVDKQDKGPKHSGTGEQVGSENERGKVDIKTTMLIILEDYADPFDAEKTREQREAEREGENDGYMEPYDAQVIITGIRRRGSKDLLKVCVLLPKRDGEGGKPAPPQIYDTPYEGLLETDGEAGGVWIPVTRPESDPRPPGEYEHPWEWRKEDIVRALTAQFKKGMSSLPPKEEAPPPIRQQTLSHQQTLRQKTWNKKVLVPSPSSPTSPILKLSPPSPLSHSSPPSPTSHSSPTPKLAPSSSPPSTTSTPNAETAKVDPTLPLEKQRWYHGSVSRQQAEAQLQRCRDASFLVRDSESGTSKYSIALKTSQCCVHIIVAQTKGSKGLGYTLDQSSCVFNSIPEVVHHYCTHRLPFTGAEHMTLQHPVPRPH